MNRLFKSAYNLVNVSVGYIRVFFLVVYGKKVNARVCDIDDHIQCDNSESPSFPASFAFYTKTDFVFPTSERSASLRIFQLTRKNLCLIR